MGIGSGLGLEFGLGVGVVVGLRVGVGVRVGLGVGSGWRDLSVTKSRTPYTENGAPRAGRDEATIALGGMVVSAAPQMPGSHRVAGWRHGVAAWATWGCRVLERRVVSAHRRRPWPAARGRG